ncbi:ExbD/TolR family protein [Kiloniella sp.]|uniref:ExbD/TolR family protein n=1 Tax=Kiloniella sp. TaxID=1938587 RepID=UPI003A90B291
MRLNGENTDKLPVISLTPLIDVVFILLIFFMLASSFLDWRELSVQGQEDKTSTSPPSSPPKETIRLSLFHNGLIKHGAKTISQSDLDQLVTTQTSPLDTIKVFISVDDGVEMQNTLDLLQDLKALGLLDLTLIEHAKP